MSNSLIHYTSDGGNAINTLTKAKDMTYNGNSTLAVDGNEWGADSDSKKIEHETLKIKDVTGHTESYSMSLLPEFHNFSPKGISSNAGARFKFPPGVNTQDSYAAIEVGPSAKSSSQSEFSDNFVGPCIRNVMGFSMIWQTVNHNHEGSFARPEKVGLIYAEWDANKKKFIRHTFPCKINKYGSNFKFPGKSRSIKQQVADGMTATKEVDAERHMGDTVDFDEHFETFYWPIDNDYNQYVRDHDLYWMGAIIEFKSSPIGYIGADTTECYVRNFRPLVISQSHPGALPPKRLLFNRVGGSPLSDIRQGKFCIA